MEQCKLVHTVHWDIHEVGMTHVWGIILGEFGCHVNQHSHGGFYSIYVCVGHIKAGPLWCLNNPQNNHHSDEESFFTQKANHFVGIYGCSVELILSWLIRMRHTVTDRNPASMLCWSADGYYGTCNHNDKHYGLKAQIEGLSGIFVRPERPKENVQKE